MPDWTRDADVPYSGKSGEEVVWVDVTPTLQTSAYTANRVLFATAEVANALKRQGGRGRIQSLIVIDRDDEGIAFDLWLLETNVSMGAIDAAPAITDDNAAKVLGVIPIATTDYKDLGGVKVACFANLERHIKAADGANSIFIAGVNGAGTPTFTAADDIRLRFGIVQA